MAKDDTPRAIEGTVYSKDEVLPMDREPAPTSLSLFQRMKLHSLKKTATAMAELEEAEARFEAARLSRMENYERAARQATRLAPENLEKITEAESATIQAELMEAKRRVEATKAEHDRQAKRDEIDDIELDLRLRALHEERDTAVDKKSQPGKRQHKRTQSRRERAEQEAESILKYGSTGSYGKIAKEKIDALRAEHGENEDEWTEELKEHVFRLRQWALKHDKGS